MNGNETFKFIGGVDFKDLRQQRVQLYNTITINLATARTDEEHVFTGNYVYALEATDIDANLNIRFNEKFRSQIKLVQGRGVRVPFYRFYITNTAQAGKTITLAIGIESDSFEVFDVGKALEITGAVKILNEIPSGATEVRESGLADNGQVVLYTVTAGKTFYLTSLTLNTYGSAAGLVTFNIDDDMGIPVDYLYRASMAANAVDAMGANFAPAIEIPASYMITLNSGAASRNLNGFIHGYEK